MKLTKKDIGKYVVIANHYYVGQLTKFERYSDDFYAINTTAVGNSAIIGIGVDGGVTYPSTEIILYDTDEEAKLVEELS